MEQTYSRSSQCKLTTMKAVSIFLFYESLAWRISGTAKALLIHIPYYPVCFQMIEAQDSANWFNFFCFYPTKI